MRYSSNDTAVVIIDPQNDVLSPTGKNWDSVGAISHQHLCPHGRTHTGGIHGLRRRLLDQFKPYIDDGNTVIASPHKVWSPQSNDLILQLRKRAVSKIILCGMLANMCVESHLRDLIENGFEVAVVRDATAGPRHPTRVTGINRPLSTTHSWRTLSLPPRRS
jgi:nicotinamidase-related amidase